VTRIYSRLRSNAFGYIALFLALSASAYAAGLAPDSVKSKHIKDGQVKADDLAVIPAVRAGRPAEAEGTDQTLNTGDVPEALQFDSDVYDTANMHTGGTYDLEQSKFFAPRAGLYEVSAGVIFSDPPDGFGVKRQLYLAKNNNEYIAGEIVPPQNPGATVMNVSGVTSLEEGDFVQAFVSHDALLNLTTPLAGDGRNFLSMTWLGRAS
jgi:hypothetical protein